MLRLEKRTKRLSPLRRAELEPVRLLDDGDLRRYIANSWKQFFSEIGQDLFLIGTEVRVSDASSETVDFLALDRAGRTVAVTLHPEDNKSHLTKSLFCVSSLAGWSPTRVVGCLAPRSRRDLEDFLEVEVGGINQSQAILLIADSIPAEEISVMEWLADRSRVECACIQVTLATDRQTGNQYLSCFQLFPRSDGRDQNFQVDGSGKAIPILIDERGAEAQGGDGESKVEVQEVDPPSHPSVMEPPKSLAAQADTTTSGIVPGQLEKLIKDSLLGHAVDSKEKTGQTTQKDEDEQNARVRGKSSRDPQEAEASASPFKPAGRATGPGAPNEAKGASQSLKLKLGAFVIALLPFFFTTSHGLNG